MRKAVTRFRDGQRVLVMSIDEVPGRIPPTEGTVVRLRRGDDGAWVALDQRLDVPGAHPFPAEDQRGRHVLVYPENCAEAHQ